MTIFELRDVNWGDLKDEIMNANIGDYIRVKESVLVLNDGDIKTGPLLELHIGSYSDPNEISELNEVINGLDREVGQLECKIIELEHEIEDLKNEIIEAQAQ